MAKRTILVECRFVISVEVPDGAGYDAQFDIEENHCPGTGIVGAALEKHMAEHETANTCWACALAGTNKIIDAPQAHGTGSAR